METEMAGNPSLIELHEIRLSSGEMDTIGLSDNDIVKFCKLDENLPMAITEALSYKSELIKRLGKDIFLQNEKELVEDLQEDYVNFYAPATVNPYVALAARGPWIITSHGAVVHDNGGYGMLGAGHGPNTVIDAMSKNWVMANIMTPSFSHARLALSLIHI